MFVLSQTNTYTWPIVVEFPVSGGTHEKQTFDAEFRHLSQSEFEGWLKKINDGEATDRDFAKHILVGWKGITSDNHEVPFSESSRDKLFDVPLVVGALIRTYVSSLAGAKAKN